MPLPPSLVDAGASYPIFGHLVDGRRKEREEEEMESSAELGETVLRTGKSPAQDNCTSRACDSSGGTKMAVPSPSRKVGMVRH